MTYGSLQGYARTNPRAPRAKAVCDYCGTWWQRTALKVQSEWYGDFLADTGYRACPRCISRPQPQLKTVILPLDPVPIDDPRPERFAAQQVLGDGTRRNVWQNLNGFTKIVGPQGQSIHAPVLAEFDPTRPIPAPEPMILTDGRGNYLYDDNGNLLTTDVSDASQKGALWVNLFRAGYAVPVLLDDFGNLLFDDFGNVMLQDVVVELSEVIAHQGSGQQIAAAATPSSPRNNILIYNPTNWYLSASQNAAPVNGISASSLITSLRTSNPFMSNAESMTVQIGTGEAMLQQIFPGPPPVGQVWQGSIWVSGFVVGQPFWAWQW